jgi:hypothetical protein
MHRHQLAPACLFPILGHHESVTKKDTRHFMPPSMHHSSMENQRELSEEHRNIYAIKPFNKQL